MKTLEYYQQRSPSFSLLSCFLGVAYAKLGQPDKTKIILDQFLAQVLQPEWKPVMLTISLLYLALGDKENFYTWYEESMKEKLVTCLFYYNSPLLAEVHGEERFKNIRIAYGLPA